MHVQILNICFICCDDILNSQYKYHTEVNGLMILLY